MGRLKLGYRETRITGEVQKELEVDLRSGYITERNALPNLTVQPETRFIPSRSLHRLVLAEVFQNDWEESKSETALHSRSISYPGRVFEGRVNFVYPQVDR